MSNRNSFIIGWPNFLFLKFLKKFSMYRTLEALKKCSTVFKTIPRTLKKFCKAFQTIFSDLKKILKHLWQFRALKNFSIAFNSIFRAVIKLLKASQIIYLTKKPLSHTVLVYTFIYFIIIWYFLMYTIKSISDIIFQIKEKFVIKGS